MKSLKIRIITGIIFVLVTGTLAHFLYEWTDRNFLVSLFVPVNESTWEHMKLVFFPMLLYSFFLNRSLGKNYPCIASAAAFGLLAGTFLIPVLFYTYTGILGYHTFPLDLATFAGSVLMAFYAVYRLTLSCAVKKYQPLLYGLVFLLTLCFFWFTWFPTKHSCIRTASELHRTAKILAGQQHLISRCSQSAARFTGRIYFQNR